MKLHSETLAPLARTTPDFGGTQVNVELPTFDPKVENEYDDPRENMSPYTDQVKVEHPNIQDY